MSAALKLATLASGLTIFTTGALYSMRTPQQDFSRNALALDHIAETQETAVLPKAKLYVRLLRVSIALSSMLMISRLQTLKLRVIHNPRLRIQECGVESK